MFILLLTGLQICVSQDFKYPVVKKSAKSINGFIPKGWDIKDKIAGDLNKDQIEDIALILEYQSIVKGLNENEFRNDDESSPRVLLILFKSKGSYFLKLQHNTFILRDGQRGEYSDPYKSISIVQGVLNINFEVAYKSWLEELSYKIRYQKGDFYLIGAKRSGRGNSGTTISDFNFSTKKYINKSNGPAGSDQKDKVISKKLPNNSLKKFIELSEPDNWLVFENETI